MFQGDQFGYYSSTNPIGASLASVKSVLETLGIIYAVVVLLLKMYSGLTAEDLKVALIIEQVVIYVIFVYELTMAVVGSVKAIVDPDKKVMGIVGAAFFGVIAIGLIVMACFKDKILAGWHSYDLTVSEWITLVMTIYLVGSPLVMLPLDIVSTFMYWDEIEL